jgi:class 3 adenylate cyclase
MVKVAVVEIDLVGYSKSVKTVEAELGVKAVGELNNRIQKFIDDGIKAIGLDPAKVVIASNGDNAVLILDNADAAHKVARAVHASTKDYNASNVGSVQRRFRIGCAMGEIHQYSQNRDGRDTITGDVIARAYRLEAAASSGELLVDEEAFLNLSEELRKEYGGPENIAGKQHDDIFRGCHRCIFVPPLRVVENPFSQKGLWGYDDLFRRIFEHLGKNGSKALIGPTGYGKTEILQLIHRQGAERMSRDPRTFLYIDMNLVTDNASFFKELCLELEIEPCNSHDISRWLKKSGRSYVLCLDTVQVLTDEASFSLATRRWLRGVTEISDTPMQLIISSQIELRILFPDKPTETSPLADLFSAQTIFLKPWTETEIQRIISDRLKDTGVTFTSDQIETIYRKSGGIPKKVRSLAIDLYNQEVSRIYG